MATISKLIHGTKPKVAPFVATDPTKSLDKLLSGEMTDWPEIQQLSQLFQQNQFEQMGFDLPGLLSLGGENAAQTEKNALAWQKGEIPQEAQDALRRFGAQQNLTSGMGFWNPSAGGANQIRNFFSGPGGLLDYQKAGIDAAAAGGNATQRWQQIAQGTMLPQSAYLYSPQYFNDFMAKQAAAKRDALQQKYNIAAQPDPAWADRAALAGNILGLYAGGKGGAGSSMNTASREQIPAGGAAGLWAQATGQPYDVLGSNTGATTTGWNNAVPFQTNPDGSLYYPPAQPQPGAQPAAQPAAQPSSDWFNNLFQNFNDPNNPSASAVPIDSFNQTPSYWS